MKKIEINDSVSYLTYGPIDNESDLKSLPKKIAILARLELDKLPVDYYMYFVKEKNNEKEIYRVFKPIKETVPKLAHCDYLPVAKCDNPSFINCFEKYGIIGIKNGY